MLNAPENAMEDLANVLDGPGNVMENFENVLYWEMQWPTLKIMQWKTWTQSNAMENLKNVLDPPGNAMKNIEIVLDKPRNALDKFENGFDAPGKWNEKPWKKSWIYEELRKSGRNKTLSGKQW